MTTYTDDKICPVCRDTYDNEASQLRPKWSDHYDNVVCTTCAETEKGNNQ